MAKITKVTTATRRKRPTRSLCASCGGEMRSRTTGKTYRSGAKYSKSARGR